MNLPQGSNIHPIFHAFKLKPFQGDGDVPELQLPPLSIENQPQVVPIVVVDSKIEGQPPREYVLVQWQGLYLEDSTWELLTDLLQEYPDLHLEGKAFSHREGADMNYEKREQCNNKQGYEKPNRKKKKPIWMGDFVTK